MKILTIACLLAVPARVPSAAGTTSRVTERPNLLLITLDTTRVDHLGCYGYALPTSPVIDSVASRGVRFTQALTQIPLTGPAHATMMTGLHPHDHGAVRNGVPLPQEARTLAERLRDAGYRTGAFLSGWTLRAGLSGLDQGFDLYDDAMRNRYHLVNTQRFAHQVTPLARTWLRRHAGERFFLWVHYFDPHAPYVRRPGLFDALGPDARGATRSIPPRILKYDSEIRHMDDQIGSLLTTLRALGLERDTLVIIAADHGEAFGEHGYVGHGRFLYEEIVRIPLIAAWPGHIAEGITVDSPVGLIDLMPTILSLLDLPLPEFTTGIDLSRMLTGDRGEPTDGLAGRRVYFETYQGARKRFWRIFSPRVKRTPILIGYRQGSLKYVYDTRRKTASVHDLAGVGEGENLIARYPDLSPSGDDLLRWVHATAQFSTYEMADREDLERLRSLGYIK
ncbi:MAG: sulfatase [Acidobacteria bacterium]|nr:sulfatase [Acidobacteriota bacterium]